MLSYLFDATQRSSYFIHEFGIEILIVLCSIVRANIERTNKQLRKQKLSSNLQSKANHLTYAFIGKQINSGKTKSAKKTTWHRAKKSLCLFFELNSNLFRSLSV